MSNIPQIAKVLKKGLLDGIQIQHCIMLKNKLYDFWGFTIPNALGLSMKSKKVKYAIKYGILIASYLWWLVFPFVLLLQAILFYKQIKVVKKDFSIKDISGEVIFGNSHRASAIIDIINDETPRTWLTVPWVKLNEELEGKYYSIFSLWSIKDFIKAYFVCIYNCIQLYFTKTPITNVIETLHAFQWVMVYINIEKFNKDISTYWYVNHYGRWAIMMDHFSINGQNVWLQHGLLEESYKPLYKQDNIKVAYTYGERYNTIFLENIASNRESISFKKLNANIKLTDIENSDQSILIIGQPNSIELDREIVKQLNSELKVFVKPHPMFDKSEYYKWSGVNVIEDKTFFPKTKLAISYGSTLGLEYETCGIRTVWTDKKELKDIMKEINKILN